MGDQQFAIWLLGQRHRNDSVGDLARDFAHSGGPAGTHEQVRRHMNSMGAQSCAIGALEQAIEEWGSL